MPANLGHLVHWLDKNIRRARSTDPRLRHVQALHVCHKGNPIYDWSQTNDVHNTFSVTKSVTALLVGIAQSTSEFSVDDVVEPPQGSLHDLLSMRRGVTASLDDIDRIRSTASGWRGQMLSMVRTERPGTRFRYDNCAAELVGYWLADTTSTSLEQLAQERLFDALGITEWNWARDPEGYNLASSDLSLRTSDLALIGSALAAALNGHRATPIPRDWAHQMVTPWSLGGPPEDLSYGYLTWLSRDRVLFAGWGGQSVTILPKQDLVIAVSGNPDAWNVDSVPARALIETALRT